MNAPQSQPSFIQLRPDSPALLADRPTSGQPTRHIAGAVRNAPVRLRPAPVPPRCWPVLVEFIGCAALGALFLAGLIAAFCAGGAL